MRITIPRVAKLNPCQDRFSNFTSNNPGFKGGHVDFLSLDNITYSDKIWVCVRLMTRKQKFQFALACAESVYELFQAKYPDDTGVRELLDYLATIQDPVNLTNAQLEKIRILRSATSYASYASYAASAAASASYASYAASASTSYASYAESAASAESASYAAREAQQDYNLIILASILDQKA